MNKKTIQTFFLTHENDKNTAHTKYYNFKGGGVQCCSCRDIYTVKELDSHAKHGQSFKIRFGSMTECHKSYFRVCTSFGTFYSIMAIADVNNVGNMGISPGRTRPCTHRPSTRFIRRSGGMSLKKCVFGCKGKITLFSFPKEPSVTWTVDAACFSGQQWSSTSVFVDEHFINKAQFEIFAVLLYRYSRLTWDWMKLCVMPHLTKIKM